MKNMNKAKNTWETPLGYYEKAITELTKAHQEIQTELQNIQLIRTSHLELQEVKRELDKQGIKMKELNTELQKVRTELKTTELIASVAQSEVKTLKTELQNVKEQQLENNKQIIEKLAEVKQQLSEKQSQTYQYLQLKEFNAFEAELSQSLSDLQLKISKLAANSTLVSSATGVDYSLLDTLLAAENWQKADEETRFLMWKISSRGPAGSRFLDDGDIKKFPWQDIHIINQLWIKYSKGHFGFSVQKQIWQTVDVPNHRNFETEKSLSRRVGWCTNDNWLSYSEFTFNLNAAKGHLPSTLHLLGRESGRVEHRMKLFSRI